MAKLMYIDDKTGQEVSIKVPGHATIDELVDLGIKPLLLALGYHPNNINDVFEDELGGKYSVDIGHEFDDKPEVFEEEE